MVYAHDDNDQRILKPLSIWTVIHEGRDFNLFLQTLKQKHRQTAASTFASCTSLVNYFLSQRLHLLTLQELFSDMGQGDVTPRDGDDKQLLKEKDKEDTHKPAPPRRRSLSPAPYPGAKPITTGLYLEPHHLSGKLYRAHHTIQIPV